MCALQAGQQKTSTNGINNILFAWVIVHINKLQEVLLSTSRCIVGSLSLSAYRSEAEAQSGGPRHNHWIRSNSLFIKCIHALTRLIITHVWAIIQLLHLVKYIFIILYSGEAFPPELWILSTSARCKLRLHSWLRLGQDRGCRRFR